MAAVSRKRHASSGATEEEKRMKINVKNKINLKSKVDQIDPESKVDQILRSRRCANAVFDIFELLQSDGAEEVVEAVGACSSLFCSLLERGEVFRGALPEEEEAMRGGFSAQEKFSIFMRHRYHGCVEMLLELLDHEHHHVSEAGLCCLMQFAAAEAKQRRAEPDRSQGHGFPRELLLALVDKLLSRRVDMSLLICRFQQFLEMDDVRYYVMSSVRQNLAAVLGRSRRAVLPVYQSNVLTLMSSISLPSRDSDVCSFLVPQDGERPPGDTWKAARLKEHKRVFEKMWLAFLTHQLPSNLYKKVLLMLHESVLPHMSHPPLMLDFLTAAYDQGGAVSLLALNGLFILIHEHNLDYPDFYTKLYSLLQPSILHLRFRSRFFHLANLFLSSSHLPAYLVAAFVKRLARLALAAPPAGLLLVLAFITNLLRRHPSCRVLLHRPGEGEALAADPYLMEEEDPARCGALESSLWELKTLQKHHHPDVSKAAALINTPLLQQEEDLSEILEMTTYQLMEQELKQTGLKNVPLEFEAASRLLQGGGGVLGQHFCLSATC